MDKSDGSFALTGEDQRVVDIVLVSPTDSALDILLMDVINVSSSFYFHGFSKFLLVELILGHLDGVALEVLHSEPDSAQLNGIELLYFVVIFTTLVFQRSGNKPESVHRFFLLSLSAKGVIQIVTL